MTDVFINPLSANRQFYAAMDVREAVSVIVECFKYLLPGLEHKRIRLVYDNTIEQRGLRVDSPCLSVDLNGHGELTRLWFHFGKNRAHKANSEQCPVVVTSARDDLGSVAGEVRRDIVQDGAKWLSFRGAPLNEEPHLRVSRADLGTLTPVVNAASLASFQTWWPRYEASLKHRRDGYWQRGEWVSPMPLDDQTAQTVLLGSVLAGDDRYAYFRGQYYRFPRTHPDREAFHGFLITPEEVPSGVRTQLL